MNTVPFLDLKAQYAQIQDEVAAALRQVCESGRFALGPTVETFERAFADYCNVAHCVAVNSGTSALHLAMRCLDIGPGDEVITVPMTFVATAWAITYVNATPVLVDIEPAIPTMDPSRLEAAITPRTRAILPVHLYGQPAAMDDILEIGDRHGVPVVEDAAQAHGARYRGRRVGGLGRIGCFSFYPGKNLGAYGEGGALVTNDATIAQRARALRDHAQTDRYCHAELGYNYRMDSFQAAVLSIKLPRLDASNAARRRHAESYERSLRGLPIELPTTGVATEAVHHVYSIQCDDRDEVRRRLTDMHVATNMHYPIPVHLQPAYSHLDLSPGTYPIAERLARRCLSLPMFPELTNPQIDRVASALGDALHTVSTV